jgi:hypothetical protein
MSRTIVVNQYKAEKQLQDKKEQKIDEEMEARSVKYSERKETLVAWGVI